MKERREHQRRVQGERRKTERNTPDRRKEDAVLTKIGLKRNGSYYFDGE